MRLIAVCGSVAAVCVAIFLSLLSLPQARQRFPDAGTYYLLMSVLLTVIALCLLVSIWPAFARQRGRYFAMISVVMVMAVIAASTINWFEKQIGAARCIAIILIIALVLLFKKLRRKTVV